MRAGTLHERVTIQRQSTATTPAWGQSTGWNDIATVWASVTAGEAGESYGQKGTASAAGCTIGMRYRADLSSADRLVWRGKVLDIVGVTDVDSRRRELEVKAVAHG
jgi:SPP1 family predicted phage head-tail adaptor